MKTKHFSLSLLLTALAATANASTTVDLQGTAFSADTLAHYYIGPGVTHTHLLFKNAAGRQFHAYAMTLDRAAAGKAVRAKVEIGNDSVLNAERITAIAQRKTTDSRQYLAAINGDFFITSGFTANHPLGNAILGFPNMSCIIDGKLAAPDIIDYNSRENALIVDRDGYMYIDATDLRYSLSLPQLSSLIDANAVNYPRQAGELMIYNSFNGTQTRTGNDGYELTLIPDGEMQWSVNKPLTFKVAGEWRHSGNSAIPADGIVISMSDTYAGAQRDLLLALKPGDTVDLHIACSLPAFDNICPDISEVVGGDVRILNNNVVTTEARRWINTPSALYSRALAGYSQDRNLMVMCAVDGSIAASSGVSYYEAADLMRFLGCWDALDLDGGGSTAIWSHSHGILNNLRDGSERAVGNGLFLCIDAPQDNTVASLRFANHAITLPRHGLFRPTVYGYNKYGVLVDTDVTGFTLTAPEELGTVTADGTALQASGEGTHPLTVTLDGMTATIPVTVDASSPARPRVDKVLLDNTHPWEIELVADVLGQPMAVAPYAFDWTSDNEAVATVDDNGTVTGLADGTATIAGSVGNTTTKVDITVECPKAPKMPVTGAFEPELWKITQSGCKNATATPLGDEGGFNLTFNVSSTRGPSVKLARDLQLYSRPDAFEITVNTGTSDIKSIAMTFLPGNSTRTTAVTISEGIVPGSDCVLTVPMSQITDTEDIAAYPMQLKNIIVTPASKTGEYALAVKSMRAVYNNFDGGVGDIVADDTTPGASSQLRVTVHNGMVSVPFVAGTLQIFDISGRLVAQGTDTSALPAPQNPGAYILRADHRTAKFIR